jgi:hypothetical protein
LGQGAPSGASPPVKSAREYMARKGKRVNTEDPIYLLDKNRGFLRIPVYPASNGYIEFRSLKHTNREAFDNNYFDLKVGDEVYRLHRDEIQEALTYV